jgi:tRNA A-37 threonylcarbamoyl transferase component Bud32
MTEEIIKLIHKNWHQLPVSARQAAPSELILLTKFHHGRASIHSKVLFLATCGQELLCLIKVARDNSANEKIQREKSAQEKFTQAFGFPAPRVYFESIIEAKYVYAEEVVPGQPLSEKSARQKEADIIDAIFSLPVLGEISASSVAKILLENILPQDSEALDIIRCLNSKDVLLKKGFSHGDFTRKNIINANGCLRLIDWERAGERPFWLLDAVHFMVTLRNIKNQAEWKTQAEPFFVRQTKIEAVSATALYCVEAILEIFCKKYSEKYKEVIRRLNQL